MLRGASKLPPSGFAALTTDFAVAPAPEPIRNPIAFEAPPPDPALNATSAALPAFATSAAATCIFTWLASTKVVGRASPFHRIVVPLLKFDPVTVIVNAGPPGFADAGDTDVTSGAREAAASGTRMSKTPR